MVNSCVEMESSPAFNVTLVRYRRSVHCYTARWAEGVAYEKALMSLNSWPKETVIPFSLACSSIFPFTLDLYLVS